MPASVLFLDLQLSRLERTPDKREVSSSNLLKSMPDLVLCRYNKYRGNQILGQVLGQGYLLKVKQLLPRMKISDFVGFSARIIEKEEAWVKCERHPQNQPFNLSQAPPCQTSGLSRQPFTLEAGVQFSHRVFGIYTA